MIDITEEVRHLEALEALAKARAVVLTPEQEAHVQDIFDRFFVQEEANQ